jgi:hypothetical protein
MTALFEYPPRTVVNRVVPKTRVYQHAGASTLLKDKFIAQVEKITWAAKLSPDTVNLPATDDVAEIQIFRIELKSDKLQDEVLKAIDRAIPSPIIFELKQNDKLQAAAARKRRSESKADSWVISDYLHTDWMPNTTRREPLPLTLNLAELYKQLLTALLPIAADNTVPLSEQLGRTAALKAKEREIERLQAKLNRETQFNIKMTLHGQIREAQAAYNLLKKPQ